MRVLIDANVFVSAFGFPRSLVARAFEVVLTHHTMLVSEPILEEVERTISVKFPQALPSWHVFLQSTQLELVEVTEHTAEPLPVRDPADAHVVAAAIRPDVDLLLTGDKDLLTPGVRGAVTVYPPAEFLAKFNKD